MSGKNEIDKILNKNSFCAYQHFHNELLHAHPEEMPQYFLSVKHKGQNKSLFVISHRTNWFSFKSDDSLKIHSYLLKVN